jgi:hypothetical protein
MTKKIDLNDMELDTVTGGRKDCDGGRKDGDGDHDGGRHHHKDHDGDDFPPIRFVPL